MTTWFSSDQHFGHANIIRFCQRPFANVAEMNAALVARWNQVVAPTDTVYVLGDFALGRITDTIQIAGQLAGHKILLAGNHDRCWDGHGGGYRLWENLYREAGFQEIRQGIIDLEVGGHQVLACHFPYVGDSHDADRFDRQRPVDEGRWLLHGHVHEKWQQWGRQINVGVDVWDFRPVSEAELVKLIEKYPLDQLGDPARERALAEQDRRSRIMDETVREF